VRYFVQEFSTRMRKEIETIPAESMETLTNYSWPGNVRELRNVIERLMLLAPRDDDQIGLETVASVLMPGNDGTTMGSVSSTGTLAARVENFERETILAELKRAGFHVTNAAKALGLERSHLYKKAEQLGIDVRKQRRDDELKQE
jgi:two-component system nitrogen regulation response regulator NtrX